MKKSRRWSDHTENNNSNKTKHIENNKKIPKKKKRG
jgi:hypothetical protein